MKPLLIPTLSTLLLAATGAAQAFDDASLRAVVEQRLRGDRTGACFAVAVIEQTVARAVVCADGGHPRPWTSATAFEIGSVTKTMNAVLLARLVADGEISLDDPIALHLPKGTKVPAFGDEPVRIRHLLTHTSGFPALPSKLKPADPANPYATLSADDVVASLADVTLKQAPGKDWAYSNFAVMLLSHVIATKAGQDYEALMQAQLFAPLGMTHSFIATAPNGVQRAEGHLGNGLATSPWDIRGDLAGVGGVRASLDDMVRYVEAHLGHGRKVPAALKATQEAVISQPRPMAWAWMLAPLNGRTVHAHEGGTGGFSSFVAFDREKDRGVVILSDTAMTTMGGLGSLGLHLLDERVPVGKPRREIPAPKELLDALVGDYQVATGLKMTLRRNGDALETQAEGQDAFVLGFDDGDEFFAREFDAALRVNRRASGGYSLTLLQGGAALPLVRIDGKDAPATTLKLDDRQLAEYAGDYQLAPGFVLKVFVEDGGLKAQATGQGSFPVAAVKADVFEAAAHGIEIRFRRGGDGKLVALDLHQAGRVTPAKRQ